MSAPASGELQIWLQGSSSQVVAAHARGGAGRILFAAHSVSLGQSHSSHFMHSLILCMVGRETYSKKTRSKMIKVA